MSTGIFSAVADFDGYPLQAYLLENIDLIGYIASCYLVMVGKGDRILGWMTGSNKKKQHQQQNGNGATDGHAKAPSSLRCCYRASMYFHAAMAVFCAILACLLIPAMVQSVVTNSFFETMCIWSDDRIYTGVVGVALGGAVLATVLEQLDTFFLVLRDFIVDSPAEEARAVRRVTPSHWWSRVLVPLYFWHTFSVGTSCFTMLAAYTMLLAVLRNVVYAREDAAALSMEKASNASVAKLSAMELRLDLLECIGCSILTVYASFMNYTHERGCMTVQANARMALVMYVTTVVLRLKEVSAEADVTSTSTSSKKSKKQQ